MDLSLITNETKSHYVYIKDFDRFTFHKKKEKSSKNVLTEHKVCLSISGPQSVRFEKGTIEFKNYIKKIPVPFKFYADFERNLNSV